MLGFLGFIVIGFYVFLILREVVTQKTIPLLSIIQILGAFLFLFGFTYLMFFLGTKVFVNLAQEEKYIKEHGLEGLKQRRLINKLNRTINK